MVPKGKDLTLGLPQRMVGPFGPKGTSLAPDPKGPLWTQGDQRLGPFGPTQRSPLDQGDQRPRSPSWRLTGRCWLPARWQPLLAYDAYL